MIRVITVSLLTLIGWHVSQQAYAQQEATMYFMKSLPQVTYTNPAIQPRYKFSLGIPGSSVFMQYANNGFAYKDFAVHQGDSIIADLDKLQQKLKTKNYITQAAQADLFRLGMKINARLYFTWNVSAKTYNRIMLPKQLTGIAIEGTSILLNKTSTISPQVESISYVEAGWGASYVVDRKLTVGLKAKLLKGFMNATTAGSKVNLSANDSYVISGAADVNVKTSGVHQLDDDDFDIQDDYKVYKKNTGFAFDLGATYKVKDRLAVGLSLIDIGSITWKNDTYGYRLDPNKAKGSFKGADLQKALNGEDDYFTVSDSLKDNFKFQEGTIAKYKTPLPGKMYLSASYELKRNFTANALLFAEKYRDRFAPGVSVSLQKEFGRRLSTSVSYTITNNAYNNIGAGISLNLAPIQIYVVGDNILGAPIALASHGEVNSYLNSAQFINFRTGINFVFGWDKTPERLPYPKK